MTNHRATYAQARRLLDPSGRANCSYGGNTSGNTNGAVLAGGRNAANGR